MMYNRYIPQSDGSYRRSFVPEPPREPPKPHFVMPPPPEPACPTEAPVRNPCPHRPQSRRMMQPQRPAPNQTGSVLGFFKNLLPRDFDVEDLLVVLLLLLMAGDEQEGQNSALLTLALYLFL